MSYLSQADPAIAALLDEELNRQQIGLELIPSENIVSQAVLEALGSIATNKYSEGYPGRRYYGGQHYIDQIENLARDRAKALFHCDHANVQPLSGSPMNQAVYLAFMKPGDTILGMDLSHGGHLTHGAPVSHMGKIFNFIRYKTNPAEKGKIDFDELMRIAKEARPKIVLCGYTSYPRDYDYADFKKVADAVGAITMADISHIGGLVAAGVMKNPFDYGFDIVTTTTHKTLRGPRGGMVLCKSAFADAIDKSVFPGLQGGPHENVIAAIAVALHEAGQPDFKAYAQQVLANSRALAEGLTSQSVELVTGGTDNHMMVANTVASFAMNGKEAERLLDEVGVTVNKQVIPDDPNPPLKPSGIRIGTPSVTTRGMKESEMKVIADVMIRTLKSPVDETVKNECREQILELCRQFPAYPDLSYT